MSLNFHFFKWFSAASLFPFHQTSVSWTASTLCDRYSPTFVHWWSTPALWHSSNCFKADIWEQLSETRRQERKEKKKGGMKVRNCHRKDGGLSNYQREISGLSFHPFVCSQAVSSPMKTKFNLLPFTHFFSLSFTSSWPCTESIRFSYPPPPHLLFTFPSLLFFLSSVLSVKSATRTRRKLCFVLLALGTDIEVNRAKAWITLKFTITPAVESNVVSFV